MSTRRVVFVAVALVSLAIFSPALWSQGTQSGTRATRPDFGRSQRMRAQQKIEEFRRLAEQQEEQAMKQALRVDEAQWKVIKPKLKKAHDCRAEAFAGTTMPFASSFVISTGPGQTGSGFVGGFSGGFHFEAGGEGGGLSPGSSSGWADYDDPPAPPGKIAGPGQASEGQRTCWELHLLLQDPAATPEQINQKLDELRKARDNGAKQWAIAQKELREVLNLHQQATLVMMGLLE